MRRPLMAVTLIGISLLGFAFIFILATLSQPTELPPLPTPMVLPSLTAAPVIAVDAASAPEESAAVPVVDAAIPVNPSLLPDVEVVDSTDLSEPVSEQVVVAFAPDTSPVEQAAYIALIGGTVSHRIDALDTVVVQVPQTTTLPASPVVVASEPDYYVTALIDVPTSDAYYPSQWALSVIGAPTAWSNLPEDAPIVIVAVIDSGVCLEHPDLAGKILPGYDFVQDDTTPQDEFGHGCGVAGIIAAEVDNGIGIAGVAPNARIMPLRVLDANGIGTYSDVAAAIVYAADNGAAIINLSLGGSNASRLLLNAIDYALARGVTVIAAAGNTGQEGVLYPAAYGPVIAVGSVDPDLQRSDFSTYGPEMDLLAPGRDILTTSNTNDYVSRTGTSFAAPHVAGIAALEIALGETLTLDGGVVALSDYPRSGDDTVGAASVFCDSVTEIPTLECEALEALYISTDGDNWTNNTGWLTDTIISNWYGVTVSDGHVIGLELPNNQLTGTIPIELGDLANLTYLRLGDNYLTGTIPPELSNLSNLVSLNFGDSGGFGDNQLTGPIPPELGNLANLVWLDLGENQLTGSIPPELGNLTNLVGLDLGNDHHCLGDNQLTGTIPPELGNLSNLEALFLNSNELTGSIPAELGNLTHLNRLYLDSNQLSGSIPSELGNLTNLQYLELAVNHLSGEIPPQLGNLTNLQYLELAVNHLSGEIPPELGNLTNLQHLFLSYNQLSGEIPSELGNLGDTITDLSYNTLEGEIPDTFTALSDVRIQYNALYSTNPTVITHLNSLWWTDWDDTQTVSPGNLQVDSVTADSVTLSWTAIPYTDHGGYYEVWYKQLPGGTYTLHGTTIDKTATSYTVTGLASATDYAFQIRTFTPAHGAIEEILDPEGTSDYQQSDLYSEYSTEVTGTTTVSAFCATVTDVPPIECAALEALYISTDGDNWKTHTGWLVNMTVSNWHGVTISDGHVTSIQLYYNQLSGNIPSELSNLVYLQILNLHRNQLGGSIPPELGNLANLRYLWLFNNQLSGSIPAELGNLTNLEDLRLYQNQLNGSIPPELGDLTNVRNLYLYENQLSGSIPPELGDLTNLEDLRLYQNQLSGSIPPELGDLINLDDLRLANNALQGEIPATIGNLVNLSTTDLGYNALYASGATATFLTSKDVDWAYTQTVAPSDLQVASVTTNSATLAWTAILYTDDDGYYEVYYKELPSGSYTLHGTTTDKSATDYTVTNLTSETDYAFQVQTFTPAHGNQQNHLTSGYSAEVTSTVGISAFCATVTEIPPMECEALAALYVSTDGDNWRNNTGWLTDHTVSNWYGVIVSDGHVKQINISSNQLSGSIPPELGDLTNLKRLYLHNNQLSGNIPPELGNLTSLEYLLLEGNQLSGSIPPELGHLASLMTMNLSGNELSGSIPPELGDLANLGWLDLVGNQLSGSIPSELGNLAILGSLSLRDNQLSGSIPPELGNLTILRSLDLGNNQLSGSIPPQLGGLTNLRYLYLFDNQLSGSIPPQLGDLVHLEHLSLRDNQLSGGIPLELDGLLNLVALSLKNNALSGEIPVSITNLTNLDNADFGYNALYSINQTVIDFINDKDTDWADTQTIAPSNLQVASETINSATLSWTAIPYTGDGGYYEIWYKELPDGVYTLHGATADKTATGYTVTGLASATEYDFQVRTFTPAHNDQQNALYSEFKVVGELEPSAFCVMVTDIPPEECAILEHFYNSTDGENWLYQGGWLVNPVVNNWWYVTVFDGHVTELSPSFNQLSGSIPPELGDLTHLTGLGLDGNQLSGSIPPELGDLTNLEHLSLYDNQLSGSIPPELGDLTNLEHLNLIGNQLSGSIPPELGNLTNLEYLRLLDNQLSGSIPPELGNLTNLTSLNLGDNQLTSIPPELGDLVHLTYLGLYNNQLSGSIPPELGDLASLGALVISNNQLSGSIPPELGDLANLYALSLDSNQLSGSIPPELGDLANVKYLSLNDNQLSGTIPTELGDLTKLQELQLHQNRLSGSIPPALGNLINLDEIRLANNALQGEIPASFSNLINLENTKTDIGYNALYASGATATFLDGKDADWADTQTIAPSNLQVASVTTDSVTLAWTAIPYTGDGGYYEVWYKQLPGGAYVLHGTTTDKSATGYTVTGLSSGMEYAFQVRTFTPAHGDQQNDLTSDFGAEVTAQIPYPLLTAPVQNPPTGVTRNTTTLSWTDTIPGQMTTFHIERKQGASSWQQIVVIPGGLTTYEEHNLACATTYDYRIRGFREDDEAYSPYSNTESLTTSACPPAVTNTIGLYKNGVWQFRDSNTTGPADLRFAFGPRESGWRALVGDWDGDGTDGIGVYKDGVWYLRYSSDGGEREISFHFNPLGAGAVPLVGDWDGDNVDTIGVYKDGVWLLRNALSDGAPDAAFHFGLAEADWLPVVGDWNGGGADRVGLYRNGVWYLHDSLTSVDRVRGFAFGPTEAGWLPVTGDWNQDGVDTIGLYKNGIWRLRNSNTTGTIDLGLNFIPGETGWQPVASYRGGVSGLSALGLGDVWQPATPTETPTALPDEGIETPEITATVAPAVTEEPIVTAAPEVTDEPTATDEPVVTDEPTATDEPVVTEEPPVTEEVVVTEAPIITEPPPTPTEVPTEVVEPPTAILEPPSAPAETTDEP